MYEPSRAHTACSWEKLAPGPGSGHGGAPPRPPVTGGIAGLGYQLLLWNLSLPWLRPTALQAAPRQWLRVAEALKTRPSWETWNPSGWLVALSQAPFDLAHHSFIGSIHPIFLLLFYSRLMAGPLLRLLDQSLAATSQRTGLITAFLSPLLLMPLRATCSGLGSWWEGGGGGEGAELVFRFCWNSRWTKKTKKKTKKCLGNFQRACPHWAESVLRYGMFRGKQAGKWPLPQACLHGQPSVRRSAFPKQQSSPWSLSLCLSFSTSLGFQKLWSKRVVSIDLWTACDREEATSYEACLLKKYLCWYLLRGRCQRRDPSLPVSVIWRKNRFRKRNPTCFHCLSHRTSLPFPRSPAEHTEPCMTTCWGSEENYHLMESPPRVRDTWQGRWSMETLGLR